MWNAKPQNGAYIEAQGNTALGNRPSNQAKPKRGGIAIFYLTHLGAANFYALTRCLPGLSYRAPVKGCETDTLLTSTRRSLSLH